VRPCEGLDAGETRITERERNNIWSRRDCSRSPPGRHPHLLRRRGLAILRMLFRASSSSATRSRRYPWSTRSRRVREVDEEQRVWVVRTPSTSTRSSVSVRTGMHAAAGPRTIQVPCTVGYTKDGVNFEDHAGAGAVKISSATTATSGRQGVPLRYELGQWDDPNAYVRFTGA